MAKVLEQKHTALMNAIDVPFITNFLATSEQLKKDDTLEDNLLMWMNLKDNIYSLKDATQRLTRMHKAKGD